MQVLISLSLALVGGLLMSRLAKKLNLPAVTAYLVAGLLLGPIRAGFMKCSATRAASTRTVVNTAWAMPTVMA